MANALMQNTSDADGNFLESFPLDEPMVEIDGRSWWRLACRDSTNMWFDLFSNWPMTKYAASPPACSDRFLCFLQARSFALVAWESFVPTNR